MFLLILFFRRMKAQLLRKPEPLAPGLHSNTGQSPQLNERPKVFLCFPVARVMSNRDTPEVFAASGPVCSKILSGLWKKAAFNITGA